MVSILVCACATDDGERAGSPGARGGATNVGGTAGGSATAATGGAWTGTGSEGGGTGRASGGAGGVSTGGGGVGALLGSGGVSTGGSGVGGLLGSGGMSAGGSGGVTAAGGMPAVGGTAGSGGTSATGGAVAAAGTAGQAGAANAGGAPGSGGDQATGGMSPTGPVQMVDAAHVRLLPGSPFYHRQELHRQGYLASFDPDRLLFEYRRLANLSQPNGVTGGYPGWDTGFIKGHMTGHYLSAASRMAVATGDTSFATKVDCIVAELGNCQAALGNDGYLAAFPSTVFDWAEGAPVDNGGIVVPYYTVQKVESGLLDAYHYLGNPQGLDVVTRMADYFRGRLADLSNDAIERMLRTDGTGNPHNEFGAMSDALSELAAVTGRPEYLEMASIFNRSWFITPLAAGEDRLEGLHANTHVAQAVGIAHTANLSGDAPASEYSWELLSGAHAFVIGGNSFHEWLDRPGVEAGPSIDAGAVLPATTAETCNSHNMLKLSSLLFARDPRMEHADYYERTLCNHILASVAPATVPDIVTSSTNPADWLEATSGTSPAYTAHDAGPATGITFRQLYEVHHQRYSVYWNLQASN